MMAWKSPVKCRLISSIGTTCAWPPPVAPPFIPKQGPSDGSRRHSTVLRPIMFSASVRPTDVVLLPSPASVGLIAVTRMSLPCGAVLGGHQAEVELGAVAAEGFDRFGRDADLGGDVVERREPGRAGNVQVGQITSLCWDAHS